MSYEKYYPGGWQSGESGGTPITPEALNHIENGIKNTYSDFAPAGYGLGGVGKWVNSRNEITASGFYCLGGADSPDAIDWFGYASMYSAESGYLIISRWDGCMARSQRGSSGWGEWEWVNPPMIPGEEYRTTERYQGKAVYVAVVDIGTLPNKTLKSVEHNIFCTNIIRFSGAKSDGTGFSYDDGTAYARLSATLYYIKVFTNIDLSDQTGMATIYYVK